jgi:hypothetical protein
MGDPRLSKSRGASRAFDTPELHELISDMQDTMRR